MELEGDRQAQNVCTRIKAAAFLAVTPGLRPQMNVENILDETYYANADSNTNISPGSPRLLRIGLSAAF
ncbi:MAG: hypothetical protein ABI718_03790 [Acidobacteriota bacterium]